MLVDVPDGIRTRLAYRLKDLARQVGPEDRDNGLPDDFARGVDRIVAQLLCMTPMTRQRYLWAQASRRYRARKRAQRAA
jgi:hypothetical protein